MKVCKTQQYLSLVPAKLCGFFFPLLHICLTQSRLFISDGMVEPQDRTKFFFFFFAVCSPVSASNAHLVCSQHCTVSWCSPKPCLFPSETMARGPGFVPSKQPCAPPIEFCDPTTFRGTSRGSKCSCPGASSSQRQGTMTRCHVPRHLCPQLTAPRSHNLPPGEPQPPHSPFSQQEHHRSTGWSSWFCCGVGCVGGVSRLLFWWCFFFFSAGCFLPDR